MVVVRQEGSIAGIAEEPPAAFLSPRVSIVMPVCNGERFLAETLASVQAQTMADYELLLVDDGSTDGSLAIAEAHAAGDPRIRVIRLPHAGVVAARNHAVSVARAPLIAIWDADDLSAPERLRVQADFLDANPDVGVLASHAWHIGEQGRVVGHSDFGPVTRDAFFALKAQNAPVFVTGVVFRADRALAVGCYDERMPVAQDLDLWTRMSDDAVVLTLPQRLYAYRVHAESASTRRFFEQMALTGLIAANTARRRNGLEELSPDDWARQTKAQPLRARLARARTWHSRYFYRVAGGRLAAGRLSGAPCLALAALLAPLMVARRLRTQLCSRRSLEQGGDSAI